MEKIKFRLSGRILWSLALAVILLAFMMPRKGIFKYTYQKGGTWNYETLVAPFDFPILKTAEEIENEEKIRGSQAYIAYYRYSEPVFFDVSRQISTSLEQYPALSAALKESLAEIYSRGIYSAEESSSLKLGHEINPYVVFTIRGKNQARVPFSEIYELSEVRQTVAGMLEKDMEGEAETVFPLIRSVTALIQPNLLFDAPMTEFKNQESRDAVAVSLGVFRAGETIVRTGDVITPHDERLLDSFKAEFNNTVGYDGPVVLLWLGDFLMAVILTLMLLTVTVMARPKILGRFNEFAFVLAMFVLSAAVTFLFVRLDITDKIYLVPYPVFALYMVSFFRNKLVMPVYMTCLVPILVFCDNGMRLFVLFLFAGCVAVFAFSRLHRGWQQFIAALSIFISMVMLSVAMALIDGTLLSFKWTDMFYMLPGALFVVLAYPLVYLFEIIFNLVSDSRLMELSDTGNELLRELGQKAPGTFQHSIAVMNMVDYVGKRMDVDVPLLRAAALYHDVGKLSNPLCFVENQVPGVDFHAQLTPKQSAAAIISHVTEGLVLAEKYRIPSVIRDFISTHHGTTSTGYFFTKYLNDGGDPQDVDVFYYPGPAPRTKEQVILMLCDSVDAASRILSSFDDKTVSTFVDKIYTGKFEAGQFNESDITLSELETLKGALKQYIVQLHHGRIAYPERIINNKINRNEDHSKKD